MTARHFPLFWQLVFVTPRVYLNGHQVQCSGWGRTVIPVWPGRYDVHVYAPYLLPTRVGPADCAVDVPPGGLVELEYKAPVWAFSRGALGPAPQRYNGLWSMIALTAALVLLMVAGVVTYLALA